MCSTRYNRYSLSVASGGNLIILNTLVAYYYVVRLGSRQEFFRDVVSFVFFALFGYFFSLVYSPQNLLFLMKFENHERVMEKGDILQVFSSNGFPIYLQSSFFDETYYAYSEETTRAAMRSVCMVGREAHPQSFDCDDFAIIALAGLRKKLPGSPCFVTALLMDGDDIGHGVVSCLSSNNVLMFYDTQTCYFSTPPSQTLRLFG